MKEDLKICITGPQSQGKSTLLSDLKEHPQFKDFQFYGNITRGLKEQGYGINEDGDTITQYMVVAKHIEHAYKKGKCVLDRCIIDGIVYSLHLCNCNKVYEEFIHGLYPIYPLILNKYDYIFYTGHEIPLVDDGTRSIDVDFFNNICKLFDTAIDKFPHKDKIIKLTGNREDRVKQVIDIIYGNKS